MNRTLAKELRDEHCIPAAADTEAAAGNGTELELRWSRWVGFRHWIGSGLRRSGQRKD
jgi:hypothetical protein